MMAHGDLEARRSAGLLSARDWVGIGLGSGLLGGIAMAAPIVIWDWLRSSHVAFELPMAATAWLFGLQHFTHASNLAWPVVLGFALLAAYGAASGIAFTGLADRVFGVTRPAGSLVAGLAWSFVSFMFFWYMLLPIARDGVPFRVPGGAASLFEEPSFVAPNWVYILGFTLLGLVTGACYAALRSPTVRDEAKEDARGVRRFRLHHAA